jgi:AAA domain/Bifunctional DNA primase/polymerase, N-terminal
VEPKGGAGMTSTFDIAAKYMARGWHPVPIPYRKKGPTDDEWHKRNLTEDTLPEYFNCAAQNVGVQLGPKSNGLTDIDLDCPEAIKLARYFLPRTDAIFGRASKSNSHLLYYIDDAPNSASIKHCDLDKEGRRGDCIVELRMGGGNKGAQTVFPGSVHESGEAIEWVRDGEPAKSTFAELRTAVNKIAAATILIRGFPAMGSRHDAALALGGFLARAGWDEKNIGHFVESVRRAAGINDPKASNLEKAAVDAAGSYLRGEKVYGLPGLIEFFGEARANKVAKIVGYNGEAPEDAAQWEFSDAQVLRKLFPGPDKEAYTDAAGASRTSARQQPNSPKGFSLVCAKDIILRPKQWLWVGHLLRGAQELMSGLPGLGKSQAQISFVACVTTGLPWPNGAKGMPPASVIMLTAEDVLDQEVLPRLIAAGADLSRVHILKCIRSDGKDRQFMLGEDLDALERAVKRVENVGLITIDPITAYMGSKMDSHKTTEVRAQLGPLKDFAERTNIAISTITHPPKSTSQNAIDQFIGSQAFIAAGRIGHVCIREIAGEEGQETGRVLFANAKNNPHTKMPTLAFRVTEIIVGQDEDTRMSISAPRVVWEKDAVNITADEAVHAASAAASGSGQKGDDQKKAQAFLREILGDHEPVLAKEIYAEGKKRGFSEDQLKRAKSVVGGISVQKTRESKWTWQLFPDFRISSP